MHSQLRERPADALVVRSELFLHGESLLGRDGKLAKDSRDLRPESREAAMSRVVKSTAPISMGKSSSMAHFS